MQTFLEMVVQTIQGSAAMAMVACLLWGGLSVVLSPCHLAGIPLLMGFISGRGQMPAREACWMSLLFSLGILVTIALIGCVTALAGWILGDLGVWANYAVAGLFFVIGLHLLGVFGLPVPQSVQPTITRRGGLASFILGLCFGIALGPCTFAYLAPMLGIVFRAGSEDVLYGSLLLLLYGFGHCAVIVVAGTSTHFVQQYLNWNEHSRMAVYVKRFCGGLVVLGGLYLIYVT